MTDRSIKSGDMLGIEVIDHLIIAEEKYLSFANEGIMDALKQSGLYELEEREKEHLRKLKIEKEKAAEEKNLEIAKKLKEEGMEADFIKKVTCLPKRDISKL